MMKYNSLILSVRMVMLLITIFARGVLWADEPEDQAGLQLTPGQLKYFEERIRPVLVEHCYSCHSVEAKSVKGGLFLDSREGIRTGGDSGPALVTEKPEESLLLEALRHESLEMPPDRKLPADIIADFETWIRSGAPDPRSGTVIHSKRTIDIEKGRDFWSFRPVVKPEIPSAGADWSKNEIDRFIAEARSRHIMDQEGTPHDKTSLSTAFATDATPDVLIRRLTFVLTGLPPTVDEQLQFAREFEAAPEAAMASNVDRLLNSPRFGERWGRHWLDVTRFAESTGGGRSLMLPDAWRFRDYVIRSFNDDKPFDQLVREHLAGDLLPAASDEQRDDQLTGVGYLMLGAINYEEQDKEQLRMDVVDEQIDSMGRSFLGMTLGCCRCHDHKFDPVPTSDYYALAGIFRSTKSLTPGNVCGFVTAPLRLGYDKVAVDQWAARDANLQKQIAAMKAAVPGSAGRPGAPSLNTLDGVIVDDSDAQFEGEWTPSKYQQPFIGAGYHHSGQPRRGVSVRYEAELPADGEYVVRMVINHDASRSGDVPVLIEHADGESLVSANQKVKPPGDGVFAELGRFRFEAARTARVIVKATDAAPGYVIADAIQFVPSALMPSLVKPKAEAASNTDLAVRKEKLRQLEEERKTHAKSKPEVPVVMCVEDEKVPADWHVHIRGEIRNLGAVVPRGFITAATPVSGNTTLASLTSATTSGRRELADWVASPRNPLTARVYANRIWAHVMGEGIVRSPDNFGETGERPSHPELLDYLAASFVEDGWSTKKLIRRLCLSRTFRMSSSVTAEQMQADPSNLLVARACRRRLDAEAVRDSLLQISGSLDLTILSGQTIGKISTYDNEFRHSAHPLNARSVFVPFFRNTMLDLFEIFDGANPNLVTGKRTQSTRPAQALFMLNSPFVMEQAQHAADTFIESDAFHTDDMVVSIRNVWRMCIGREPTAEEAKAALSVVGEAPHSKDAWAEVFHALFASVDFRYLE